MIVFGASNNACFIADPFNIFYLDACARAINWPYHICTWLLRKRKEDITELVILRVHSTSIIIVTSRQLDRTINVSTVLKMAKLCFQLIFSGLNYFIKQLIVFIICRTSYGSSGVGVVTQQLYTALTRVQMGLAEDSMDWIVKLK